MPYKIVAHHQTQRWELLSTFAGLTLLEELQHQQVPIKSSCMGKGVCHQCRIHVDKGIAPVTAADRKTFSDDQLKSGWRLSCCIRPKANIEFSFPQIFVFQDRVHVERLPEGDWWLACDMGTTGVEVAGIDRKGPWAIVKSLNRQVSAGADVMTRLEFAQRNGVAPLYQRISQQLLRLASQLEKEGGGTKPRTMWIAGNSAVTAFLLQQPIESLAVAPYQPVTFDSQTFSLEHLKIETLPLLYSFVGGDLFAGLYWLWTEQAINDTPWILMDVGTNSEILFWTGETLFVSSTPAGPAFEGSSISIGMRAEDGAILDPRFNGHGWDFHTVSDDVAKGICGTGLVQMIGEGVRHGLIAQDGEVLRPELLRLTSDLELTQDDVREFQLAKSAIATGLQLVRGESQVVPEILYLAGAFGEHLPLSDCQDVGLLPRMKTETLGNSSLKGTIRWGQATPNERHEFSTWVHRVLKPIELAMRDDFQTAFVQNMSLTEHDVSLEKL